MTIEQALLWLAIFLSKEPIIHQNEGRGENLPKASLPKIKLLVLARLFPFTGPLLELLL